MTALLNSCATKSRTLSTAVLAAVMVALSSLLWAAARSFRCWLLLFIAVLSSSAVCLTVSQTAQNQKLDPTILNSVSVKIISGLFVSSEQRLWSESGDSLVKDEVCNCPKDWLISVRQYAATAASDYISCTAVVCHTAYSLHLHITVRLLALYSSDASICITPFPFAIYSQSDFWCPPWENQSFVRFMSNK